MSEATILATLHDVVGTSVSSINVKNPRCHEFCAVQAAHGEDPCFEYNLSHSRPCDQLLFWLCNKRRLCSKFWGDIVVKPQRALPGDYHVMIKRTAFILSVATLSFALAPATFAEDAMKKDTMSKDAMSKDSMSKDSMKKDSMSKDSMSKDAMSKDSMSKAAMKKDDGTKNERIPGGVACARAPRPPPPPPPHSFDANARSPARAVRRHANDCR